VRRYRCQKCRVKRVIRRLRELQRAGILDYDDAKKVGGLTLDYMTTKPCLEEARQLMTRMPRPAPAPRRDAGLTHRVLHST
jgi:hypothetical protein